jgi:hypothetical protein
MVAVAVGGSALTIMFSGSLTTGQPALGLAAALGVAAVASFLLPGPAAATAGLGVALVCWFGLLLSARFFADLTTCHFALLFLAPLLGALPRLLPRVRRSRSWIRAGLALFLVAIPVALVVFQAQRQFARDSASPATPGGTSADDYSNFGK